MSDIFKRHIPLFYTAAVYNFMGAAVPLIVPDLHFKNFFTEQAASSGVIVTMITQAFWVSVLFFGIG